MSKIKLGLVGIIILAAGIIVSVVLSNQKEPMMKRPVLARQKPIKILTVKNQDLQMSVELTGPLVAYNKVELYAEVSGVLQETPKRFKEGFQYQKGEVLIRIDDRVFKNNLLAQKSSLLNQLTLLLPDLSLDFPDSSQRWQSYLKGLNLEEPLKPLPAPESEKERYYIASRNIYNLYYTIKSLETTLSKYTLKAHFVGVVTESRINPGTLVRIGQKLGEFTNTELYEMEAAVSLFDVARLKKGQEVVLKSEGISGSFKGQIQRINKVVDRNTMRVKVYIHVRDSRLRDGMFLEGQIKSQPIPDVFAIPKDLLIDQNRLYVVKDRTLNLRTVKVIGEKGGKAIIRGLANGTHLLGEVWEGAGEGEVLPLAGQGKSGNGGKGSAISASQSRGKTGEFKRGDR